MRGRRRYTGSINNVFACGFGLARALNARTHKETPKLACGGVDGKFATFLTRLSAPQTPKYFKTRSLANAVRGA